MRRQEVGRVSQRALMVLVSLKRHRLPETALLFRTCQPTVRFWIKRYNQEDPSGLYVEPRSGRPRKAGEAAQDTLQELLQDDPQRVGYLTTFWTVAMLVVVLAHKLQLVLSASTLRKVFHQLNLRWRRPRR